MTTLSKKFFIYEISNKDIFNKIKLILYTYGFTNSPLLYREDCFLYSQGNNTLCFFRKENYTKEELKNIGYNYIPLEDILRM